MVLYLNAPYDVPGKLLGITLIATSEQEPHTRNDERGWRATVPYLRSSAFICGFQY